MIPIAEEMRERCETNAETKARKDAGGTRVEGWMLLCVRSTGSRMKRMSSEKGRPRASTIFPPPSEQQRIEHGMTHLPFRSWCRHCIKGRGREEDCRKSFEEDREVPETLWDYMFTDDEKEGHTSASLWF